MKWRGSMEWMVGALGEVDLLDLLVGSPDWPEAARIRLFAAAEAAGRTVALERAAAFARGELVRAPPTPMPDIF